MRPVKVRLSLLAIIYSTYQQIIYYFSYPGCFVSTDIINPMTTVEFFMKDERNWASDVKDVHGNTLLHLVHIS